MLDLTFGEQVKIILSRRGMTIKELAEIIEEKTGKKMSRQNLTQRLGRDNFQEQDMRMIAGILNCPFQLNILDERTPNIEPNIESGVSAGANTDMGAATVEKLVKQPAKKVRAKAAVSEKATTEKTERTEKEQISVETPVDESKERDITIGELVDIHEEIDSLIKEKVNLDEDFEEAVLEEEDTDDYIDHDTEEYVEDDVDDYIETVDDYIEADVEDDDIEGASSDTEDRITLEEVEEFERELQLERTGDERKGAKKEEEKKPRGWRSYLLGRRKKDEPKKRIEEEVVVEEAVEEAENVGPAAEKQPVKLAREWQQETDAYDELQENYETEYEQPAYVQPEYGTDGYEEAGYTGVEYEQPEEVYEEPVRKPEIEDRVRGDVNPYTGHEYKTNSVRIHPNRIGYVQVYDRSEHQWTDMTEWAFLGYQERKKALLGKDYEPPIYLD